MTDELKQQLDAIFGKRVNVEFIDTKNGGLKDHPGVSRVVQMGYSFPIVTIDGQPRFAGGIDVNAIQSVIKEIQ